MKQGSDAHPRPGPEAGGFGIRVAVVRRDGAAAAGPADLQLLPPKNSVLAVIRTSQRFDQVDLPPGLQETAAGRKQGVILRWFGLGGGVPSQPSSEAFLT